MIVIGVIGVTGIFPAFCDDNCNFIATHYAMEVPLAKAVLKMLEDRGKDIFAIAIKWLGSCKS